MIPWWGTAIIGAGSGLVGGVLGAILRERILHGQRRKWDKSVMRKEAPVNLENAAEYVLETWDSKKGPTTVGEQAERDNAIETMDSEVDKYKPVLSKDAWKTLRATVRDMRTGADRRKPVDVRSAADRSLETISELDL